MALSDVRPAVQKPSIGMKWPQPAGPANHGVVRRQRVHLDADRSPSLRIKGYEQNGITSISGGDSAIAEYRHPFALHGQRNLCARTHLERGGCVRENALQSILRRTSA